MNRDLYEVILFWSEVKWVTVKFLGTKVPCTLGWPYTEGTWLYCDYFVWCVSCTVVVLTGFVMCGCFGNMCTCIYCVFYCLYCVLYCFVYVYLFLFVLSLLVYGLLPPRVNSIIAVSSSSSSGSSSISNNNSLTKMVSRSSRWPYGLRRRSTAAR
jgi:hypothetical protein